MFAIAKIDSIRYRKCMNAIAKAVSLVGTQKKIADMLEIPPACVSQWCKGVRKVPPRHCRRIEQATSGAVTRYDLRPDIFGPLEEQIAFPIVEEVQQAS
ncbi:helix-turn-helix domain-containing protein [Microbulbifer sp. 2201CG32-9]|uniref:helix-turn-helix domain-containing protein n=1 Tax=unclassified Microbulbifer TaxID=2619833 RepID=UPI00345BDD99